MAVSNKYQYQEDALAASKGREFFAYFMDPGTGKTRVLLKDAERAYLEGKIDALVVICDNSVKTNWVAWPHNLEDDEQDQVDTWIKSAVRAKGVWMSNGSTKDQKAWMQFENDIDDIVPGLIVLVVNFEALLIPRVYDFLTEFLKGYRTMLTVDESTRIGKFSQRTRQAIKLSALAPMRRILSGTPILKSPMKIYYQFRFLKPGSLGFSTMTAFRAHFAVLGGFKGKDVIGYQNEDELSALIAKHSFRVTKEEAGIVVPQVYNKLWVDMTQMQAAKYKEMRKEFFTVVNDEEITAQIVLAQMTRLQQITGGYCAGQEIVPSDKNPKLKAALAKIQDVDGQVVVWARFIDELKGMVRLLEDNGISCYAFHGEVPETERLRIRKDFKAGKRRVMVGNQQTGGIGIDEFKVAKTVIFISNDADTEKRKQAEDRNHRIGSEMHNEITYYDVVCSNTVDVKMLRIMREDAMLSAKILKEKWREWL